MGGRQFRGIIPQQVLPYVFIARIVMGHGRHRPHMVNGNGRGTVGLGGFGDIKGKDVRDHVVRIHLGGNEVPQRIGDGYTAAVGTGEHIDALHHMRMGTDDHIRPPIGQFFA